MQLWRESGGLYSFVLDWRADRYGTKELATNAVANAQVWHRKLGHLHAQSLNILRKRDSTGIVFKGTVSDCEVCTVGKAQQLAHPKTANHKVNRPFQLFYEDLMGLFTPVAIGGYKYVIKMINYYTKWTAVYLLTSRNQAFQSLQLFVGSTVILLSDRIVRWHADKGGEYTREEFRQYCLETGTIQEFAANNTSHQTGVSERVGRSLFAMVRRMLADSGFHCPCGGSCSWRLRTSRTGLCIRRSRWRSLSRCFTATKPTSRTLASSEPEPSSSSRSLESLTPRPGKRTRPAKARRENLTESLKPKYSPRRGEQGHRLY